MPTRNSSRLPHVLAHSSTHTASCHHPPRRVPCCPHALPAPACCCPCPRCSKSRQAHLLSQPSYSPLKARPVRPLSSSSFLPVLPFHLALSSPCFKFCCHRSKLFSPPLAPPSASQALFHLVRTSSPSELRWNSRTAFDRRRRLLFSSLPAIFSRYVAETVSIRIASLPSPCCCPHRRSPWCAASASLSLHRCRPPADMVHLHQCHVGTTSSAHLRQRTRGSPHQLTLGSTNMPRTRSTVDQCKTLRPGPQVPGPHVNGSGHFFI